MDLLETSIKAGFSHQTEYQTEDGREALSLATFTLWVNEIAEQPAWRARADREMDYCDGNQLDAQILQKMKEIGMPPAIEPLMGPTIDAVLGAEVKNRTDWRVTTDDNGTDDVATALNVKLNQAERLSGADTACSEAYAPQIKVGMGWVEVSRNDDPFCYKYRCLSVHRNEIFFDWYAKSDMSDARYLIRRKWTDRAIAKLKFPHAADLIEHAGAGWLGIDPGMIALDGGSSTGLSMSYELERGWSIEEQEWRDVSQRRVCLFEVWYRVWESVVLLRSPDGRIVEFDQNNPAHLYAVSSGLLTPVRSDVARVRQSWWVGPHCVLDRPSPYKHGKFPYVPFWGKREDRTKVPFGLARGMMYLQDEVNARISKMQWGLAAVRTTRTKGAVAGKDEQFRQEVSRPDADIILDQQHMAKPGAVFKVERDFELNRQQYERLIDAREGIRRTGGIYSEFQGQNNNTTSGVQFNSQVEQSNQALADINDEFRAGRTSVGDILLSLIIEDSQKQEEVKVDGKGIRDDRIIALNVPQTDPATGVEYLDNDVQRTKAKVTLSDVPSSPSFRAQQLAAMSQAYQAAPPEFQRVMMPHMLRLMDVPDRDEIIREIRKAGQAPTEEQIQERIAQAVEQAIIKARIEVEYAKLAQNKPLIDAQVRKAIAEAVTRNVEGMFSATQAANQIAAAPGLAEAADSILLSGGFVDANAPPAIPAVNTGGPVIALPRNTNPLFPSNPAVGMKRGIEGGESTGATP